MDEAAKEAEFSKRTVYVYVDSKEQIYFEIMIRGYRLLIEMIEKSFQENLPQNALEELHCIFFTFFRFSTAYPEYFKAIMNTRQRTLTAASALKTNQKQSVTGWVSRFLDTFFMRFNMAWRKGACTGNSKVSRRH
jgi:AcrR family transcriptional regulator